MKFNGIKDTLIKMFTEHKSEIATGLGITLCGTAIVLSVKATVKSVKMVNEQVVEEDRELTKKEVVKTCWKNYIPTVVSAGLGTACLITSLASNNRKNAALATAYSMTERAYSEYREQVKANIGEEKEKEIYEKVKTTVPEPTQEIIYVGDDGKALCLINEGNIYIRSSKRAFEDAINKLNAMLRNENYASLNDFYSLMGISYKRGSDKKGWNIDNGFVEISFDTDISEDGMPMLVIDFDRDPREDFDKMG